MKEKKNLKADFSITFMTRDWIVLMITIDPPPERVKIHAGVKKKTKKQSYYYGARMVVSMVGMPCVIFIAQPLCDSVRLLPQF